MEHLLNSRNVQEAGEPDYKLLNGILNLPVWPYWLGNKDLHRQRKDKNLNWTPLQDICQILSCMEQEPGDLA